MNEPACHWNPGIWTSYFIDLSPEEMVGHFAGKNWRHLELSSEHSTALLSRGEPARVGKEFRAFAAGHGVTFPQGHLWLQCDIAANNQPAVLDILKKWLDLFATLGITAAVIHPGGLEMESDLREPADILDRQVTALRTLTGHVRGTGLTICLENVIRPGEMRRLPAILDACACDGLGICLDTGHLNIAEGEQAAFIRTAGRRLKAIHLADNDGKSDQHLMPYGPGTVRWSEVGPTLQEVGYAGLFNFEVPGETYGPVAARLAKLDFLMSIVPILIRGGQGRTL